MATSKRTGEKPNKKAIAKRAAQQTGLGREGTMTYFFRNAIVNTKKTKATVLREARKKFPDNDIPDAYYNWFVGDCKRKGLIDK